MNIPADYEEILKMRSLVQAWLEYVIGDGSNTLESVLMNGSLTATSSRSSLWRTTLATKRPILLNPNHDIKKTKSNPNQKTSKCKGVRRRRRRRKTLADCSDGEEGDEFGGEGYWGGGGWMREEMLAGKEAGEGTEGEKGGVVRVLKQGPGIPLWTMPNGWALGSSHCV
ncbi:hypothetical protein RHMOL_Rhmol03G0101900 [Rhododendron molle]|uniref:Uncharacterized protein n=1 Tax=Rhododendron molle TaxID=49168 RepID=A0ACC0PF04_RHOML|nr:hypothetical protein RHMOL_Rhmol03G0101900 [Rhododendron molle]